MKKLIIILGVVGTSVSAVLVRIANAPSLVLVLYRVSFAAAFLLPVLIIRHRQELKNIPKRDFILSAFSGIFLGFHFAAYFQSLRFTSIASSVVLVDTEVFFIAWITFLLFGEKVGRKCWLGILLTFAGSVIVAFSDAGSGSNVLIGDIIALAGALCLACYTTLGVFCRRTMSTIVYTFMVYAFAAITALIVLFVQGVKLIGYDRINILSGLGLALFCTLLGHSLFSWGLKFEKPVFVSAVKMLEPVFATIWGMFLFSEIPSAFVIVGGSLIIIGIIYYTTHHFQNESTKNDLLPKGKRV